MLSEKTLANIQLKMNDVNYLWHDNFCPDLKGLLSRWSALKQPVVEESYSSFASVFVKPKNPSGYGLSEKKVTDKQVVESDFTPAPRLGR